MFLIAYRHRMTLRRLKYFFKNFLYFEKCFIFNTFVTQIPSPINRYLRDYQRNGVQFLYDHYVRNEGAILADDMGLGKTVQVIAFLAAIQRKTGTNRDVLRMKPAFLRQVIFLWMVPTL